MDIIELHKLIDDWAAKQGKPELIGEATIELKPPRTDGKRAVRTKSTGDRVYLIDDNAKTKAWITSPEILAKLGFEMNDVVDLDDKELVSYAMAPSIYRVDE